MKLPPCLEGQRGRELTCEFTVHTFWVSYVPSFGLSPMYSHYFFYFLLCWLSNKIRAFLVYNAFKSAEFWDNQTKMKRIYWRFTMKMMKTHLWTMRITHTGHCVTRFHPVTQMRETHDGRKVCVSVWPVNAFSSVCIAHLLTAIWGSYTPVYDQSMAHKQAPSQHQHYKGIYCIYFKWTYDWFYFHVTASDSSYIWEAHWNMFPCHQCVTWRSHQHTRQIALDVSVSCPACIPPCLSA